MRITCLFVFILLLANLSGAFLENIPMTLSQPNGEVFNCYASGDEFFNYLHDQNKYTIIQSTLNGFYYYATKIDNKIVPSVYKVGSVNPQSVNLQPNTLISKEEYLQRKNSLALRSGREAPTTGTVNNITMLIRFSDQEEFDIPRSVFINRFNSLSPDSISMRSYFDEVSYNQLNVETTIYPTLAGETNLSYVDSNPRAYYSPYNAVTNPIGYNDDNERGVREQTLIRNTVEALEEQVPTDLNVDADNDGAIDNICFIIKGRNDAWADLLWAHKWSLFYYDVTIHDIHIDTYTFQPETQNTVRTLSHEMFHSLGAPDLYHYEHDFSTPVGVWDIMERGSGHMLMWMKKQYGQWVSAPEEISNGVYTLNKNTSPETSFYKIASPNASEFFILEYRNNTLGNYESTLPQSGLLIYRINIQYTGNAYNGDEIYIYRKDGTPSVDGNIMEACLTDAEDNNTFSPNTNPYPFLSNGTAITSFSVQVLSMEAESITFSVNSSQAAPNIHISSLFNNMTYYSGHLALQVTANNDVPLSHIAYYINDQLLTDTNVVNEPYNWSTGDLTGWVTIKAIAYDNDNNSATDHININLTNGNNLWFDWMGDTTADTSIAIGNVPLRAAVSYQLNSIDNYVQSYAMDVRLDGTSTSSNPGIVHPRILRADIYGVPQDEVLLDFGLVTVPLDGMVTFDATAQQNSVALHGPIAFVVDVPDYHRVMVDTSGVTGYTWRTNSEWAWKNLSSYGVNGTACLRLKLSHQEEQATNESTQELSQPLLLGNYPNPFNPETSISFVLPKSSTITIAIYNSKGQLVKSIPSGFLPSGEHTVQWNGEDNNNNKIASGIYFYRIEGIPSLTKKMLLIK